MRLTTLIFICLICISVGLADIQCPDKRSICPDGTTCCQLTSGQWGCCPMPNAVCCSDKLHCCPEDTTCDLQQQTCVSSLGSVPMSKKYLARSLQIKDIQCDSTGSVACPDGTTCCKMESGDWGCCPLPRAVCCQDKIHCCPEKTICNMQEQKCVPKTSGRVVPWSTKFPSKTKTVQAKNVQCDPQYSCPDNTTCCKLESGDWGCCPMPDAVCCDDKIHCCPEGTTCDLEAGTCKEGREQNALTPLIYAKKLSLSDTQCPDPSKTCSTGDTCCKRGNPATWGCCPLPHAVCCPDGVHCCPSGAKCNNESKCISNVDGQATAVSAAVPIVTATDSKNAALLFPAPNDLVCPDQRSVCQGNAVTCCMQESGMYGCCPMKNAVCCSNRKFCCPQNTTCPLLPKSRCVSPTGELVAAMSIQTVDSSSSSQLEDALPLFKLSTNGDIPEASWSMCPNGRTKCLDSTTCCETSEGYACCPHTDGQCCRGGQHCCPKGTVCDSNQSKCISDNGSSFVWSSLIRNADHASLCPDSVHACKMGGKCCKSMLGYYSCCPDPQGECCSNGLSCCPRGYLCGKIGGTCIAVINKEGSN